jgi:hypothetical protein
VNYYNRHEVSNSDLSALKLELSSKEYRMDCESAYKFGRLIDAMITEPHTVNYYKMTLCDGFVTDYYSGAEFEKADLMKKAFCNDEFCKSIMRMSSGQNVYHNPNFAINYGGFEFELPARCKYDLFSKSLNWGADIKSTTAKTQAEFEAACLHFDYDRQRAWYMDLTGSKRDVLIGISKVNYKIFKVAIDHNHDWYHSGKEKYQDLAFKFWMLYDGF